MTQRGGRRGREIGSAKDGHASMKSPWSRGYTSIADPDTYCEGEKVNNVRKRTNMKHVR